jgi:hypothetical protein
MRFMRRQAWPTVATTKLPCEVRHLAMRGDSAAVHIWEATMSTFTISIPGGRIGHFLAGAAVASVIGGSAVAITDANFTYTTAKSGFLSISPMALAPDSDIAEYFTGFGTGRLAATNSRCFSTGVNLPHGSNITQLAVWYVSPATSNPFVYLQRTALVNGATTSLIANGGISDDTATRKVAVPPIAGGSSVVDNVGFAYGFGICPGAGGEFRGARIAYTYTSAGD